MANMSKNDLEALKSRLTAESVMILKCKNYAHNAADPIVRGLCEQMAAQHKTHYETLLNNLR